jgi:NADPH:quinone reductase-like Zn-dependent oxidoreductase
LYIAIAPPLPAVLGPDIAGAIVEVGEGVLGFSAGEKVYGCAGGVKDHGGTGSKVFSGEGEVILAIADSILRKLGTTPSNWTKRTNGFGLNCNVQTSEERQVHAMALRSRLVFASSAVVTPRTQKVIWVANRMRTAVWR